MFFGGYSRCHELGSREVNLRGETTNKFTLMKQVRLLLTFMLMYAPLLIAQENLDFSYGDFTHWDLYSGEDYNSATVQETDFGIDDSGTRLTINTINSFDDHTNGLLSIIPEGETYSARIGNDNDGKETDRMVYTFEVEEPEGFLYYKYALVFQNPPEHVTTQPKLIITVSVNGVVMVCESDELDANVDVDETDFNPALNLVKWKDWTSVGMDLSSYSSGDIITLDFENYDCGDGAHFGYTYIVAGYQNEEIVQEPCSTMVDDYLLIAPSGYDYLWSDGSTSQTISNPTPGANYTCQLTSNNECENLTIAVDVDDYGCCGLFYDIGDDFEICVLNDIILGGEVPSDPNLQYFWTGPNGFTSNEPNPTVTPTGSGVYTMTLFSEECNYYDQSSINITYNPCCEIEDVQLSLNEVGHCFGEDLNLGDLISINPNLEYTWTSADTYFDYPNPTINPLESVIYHLNISSSTCDYEINIPVTIIVEDCCAIHIDGLIELTDESASNLTADNGVISGQTYIVNGIFEIDLDVDFYNCIFYLTENAKIDIIESSLTFRNCTLQPCGAKMWDGIYLDNELESLTVSTSNILGAKNAVNAKNENVSIVIQTNTVFENNYISVLLSKIPDASNITITKTSFIKTDELLSPHTGEYSTGIKTQMVASLVVGANDVTPNNFEGLHSAIRCTNTGINVVNNTFTNNVYGIGAKVSPGEMTVDDDLYMQNRALFASQNEFYDNYIGIRASGYDNGIHRLKLWMHDNHFMGTDNYSVIAKDLGNNSIITKNFIDGGDYGIKVSSSLPIPTLIEIGENQITDVNKYGVWVMNIPSSYENYCTVETNTILFEEASNALRIGINIEHCDKIIVYGNEINRSMSNEYLPNELQSLHGIWIEECFGAIVSENQIEDLGRGIYGIGSLLNTRFNCNRLYSNYHGFHFGNNFATAISNQGTPLAPTDNEWIDNAFADSKRVENGAFPNTPIWFYRSGEQLYNPEEVPNAFIDFIATDENVSRHCNHHQFTNEDEVPGLIAIAESNYEYTELDEEYKHREKKKAYSRLREEPNLYLNDVILENFFEIMEDSPLNRILNVTDRMSEGDLSQALIENEQILSDKLYIQNRKTVNGIYLNSIQSGEAISVADSAILENIALITPFLGGDAVYSARAILDLDVMDFDIEYRTGNNTVPKISMDETNLFNVHPNPVKNHLYISNLTRITNDLTFTIYNLSGTQLISKRINMSTSIIDLNTLENGTYLYKIHSNSELYQRGKFIKLD